MSLGRAETCLRSNSQLVALPNPRSRPLSLGEVVRAGQAFSLYGTLKTGPESPTQSLEPGPLFRPGTDTPRKPFRSSHRVLEAQERKLDLGGGGGQEVKSAMISGPSDPYLPAPPF